MKKQSDPDSVYSMRSIVHVLEHQLCNLKELTNHDELEKQSKSLASAAKSLKALKEILEDFSPQSRQEEPTNFGSVTHLRSELAKRIRAIVKSKSVRAVPRTA